VADSQRLDPALLAESKRYEETQLDQLFFAEMLVKLGPQPVVGQLGIPDDGTRPHQGRLLPPRELVGALELEQLEVLLFR
jgi:hypothetical protein